MSWLLDLGFFALLFFLLVFIHELGHFLMARLVGIRVERFSIGMGPGILAKKIGDTEYRIALLPLGGYVKMSGDDPTKEYSEEEKKVGFLTQKPPAKLLVVFGGPMFNMILPIFVFGIMMMFGIPTVAPTIGMLDPELPAAQAGLRPGDRILSVDGQALSKWKEFEEIVQNSPEKKLLLGVERVDLKSGARDVQEIAVTPKLSDGKSRFGEDIQLGRLGISPTFKIPKIYFEDKESAIAAAGAENYSVVKSINGVSILTLEQLRAALSLYSTGDQIEMETLTASGKEQNLAMKVPAGKASVEKRLGILPIELVIGFVSEDMKTAESNLEFGVCSEKEGGPAYVAGIRAGDRLISINGNELKDWADVSKNIKASKGEPVQVVWSRSGERMQAELTPQKSVLEDPLMGKDNPLAVNEVYRVGISPQLEVDTDRYKEQSWNPIAWVSKGFSETWNLTSMTVQALTKLVTGQLSLKLLGSPIMIFNVAGNSYRLAGGGHDGWTAFLKTLALLSITLGLVNLLPIPVLDGGHAVFFTLEWIRGRPISLKFLEYATQFGLILLFGMFAFVLYNDFQRYDLLGRIGGNVVKTVNTVVFRCD